MRGGHRGPRPDLVAYIKKKAIEFREARKDWTGKVCTLCHVEKPFSEFAKQKKNWDGRQTWCGECTRGYNREYMRAKALRLRAEVFDKLGHSCKRCGFSDKRALQIDHVHGLRMQVRRNTTYLKKVLEDDSGLFQILCANCNWIKRYENGENPKRRYE